MDIMSSLWTLMVVYLIWQGKFLAASSTTVSSFSGLTVDLVCNRPQGANQGRTLLWRNVHNDVQLTEEDYIYENIGALYSRIHISGSTFPAEQYVLTITDVHKSDGGLYQCGFESQSGVFQEITVVTLAVVDRETTPVCSSRILPRLGDVMTDEYDITCSWSSELPNGRALIYKNGELIEPDASMPDSVIVRTVLASNDHVSCGLDAPVITDMKLCEKIDLPPVGLKVRSDPLVAQVGIGEDAEFHCTAEADEPIESYTWSLRYDAVFRFLGPTRGRFRVDDNSRRLTLLNLEEVDDMVWVECSVVGSDGSTVNTRSVIHVLTDTLADASSTHAITRRDPQELPKRTTPSPSVSSSAAEISTVDIATGIVAQSTPLPVLVISLAAAGGAIAVLILFAAIVLLVRAFKKSRSKDVEGSTVNTSWVMATTEIAISDEVPEKGPRRFGRKKSRSSSRKFLYRRSSKKKSRASQAQTTEGKPVRRAPPHITADPRGIYQNIPRNTSSSSLQSMHSRQHKLRSEMSHSYEVVKPEAPDVISYKRPRPRNLIHPRPGDEGGYASVENPEEVPPIIYADLDLTMTMRPPMASPENGTFDPSILYAKVKK